ncbi:MAG: carboxypeptidase-like regulatory domain-containing protein, partial [Phycisphaerales bacterium]
MRTDERGLFETKAEVHATREVFVVARKPGLALAWDRGPLDAPGASRLDFRLVMEKSESLSGAVVDASGKALAGAVVRALPKTCYLSTLSQSPISLPEAWLSARTDAEGRFLFDAFSADVSCNFWVRAEGYACVHVLAPHYLTGLGYEVGRSDIRLVLPQEHRVRGRVVEQGTDKPVPGLDLEISPPDDRREDIKNQYLTCRVRTDADGAFVFPGVPAGEHEIELAYPDHGLPKWVGEPFRVLVAADYAADDLKIEVTEGGIVEVLVRNTRTRKPLPGICVSLPDISFSHLPFTDSNGVAHACVRPGESRAAISSGAGANREYQSWGIQGANDRFFVIRGQTTRLELDLEPANRIRGIVVDPNGKPAPGAAIKIHPLSTGSQMLRNVGDTLHADSEGRFELACGEEDPTGWFVIARCEERG